MAKSKPKPSTLFIATEWCLAVRNWSDKWKDSNGVRGSFFYIAQNGLSEVTDLPDGNQGVVISKTADGVEPPTIMLRITGGKAQADTLPKEIYLNISDTNRKFAVLTKEAYQERTSQPSLDSDVASLGAEA